MTACTIAERVSQIGSAIPFGALGGNGLEPPGPEKQNLPPLIKGAYFERPRNRIGWRGAAHRRPRHQIRIKRVDVIIRKFVKCVVGELGPKMENIACNAS